MLTPRGVAIASAMVITLLGMGLFALVLSLYGVQAPVQAYAALALALFALSMAVTYATIERFIYQKVRIIYKNIHRFKSTKERAKDLRMNEDVMEKVQQDVMDWAQERVQEISQLKEQENFRKEFIGNLAHELKTPVTAIQALVDALAVAPADRRDQLQSRLAEESERLSRLVHDLLDLRLLEEDTDRELVSVDLGRVVRASVADATPAAEERGITFDLDLPDSAVVVGIERELALVVDNLVTNAVQYNRDEGRITIALRRADGAQVLTVADTGIGIPRPAVDRIFERFYRVDVARSRERGGTGLGLSIVRNAVERHGGRITVDSLLGEGTTFTVRLPVEPPA